MLKRFVHVLATILLLGFLVACDSSEERVESHFRKSIELYDAGDAARATVELRHVFKLDPAHADARKLMARIEEDRGNPAGAYGQYLAVTESHPEDFPAQRAAARLAAVLDDWEAASHHAKAAEKLLSVGQSDPVVQEVNLALDYRRARLDQDPQETQRISRQMGDLLAVDPGLMLARRVQVDDRFFRQDWDAALQALDAGLEHNPDQRIFYGLRLAVLQQLGRADAIEAQLRDMIDRFPDEDSLRKALVRWYVAQERTDDAEAYLRSGIDSAERATDARLMLIDFFLQLRGPEATLAEIDNILATTPADDPGRPVYEAARASLVFEAGDHEAATAEMRAIIDGAGSSEHLPDIKIALAKMLDRSGNLSDAQALVEEVLSVDATNVDALKMRAIWMIHADRADDALVELRRALDQEPRDADLFTLMAQAQERAGNRSVMGEMLSRAVEASNSAPEESLRYAAFLARDGRLLPAEGVLIGALTLQPGHLMLLTMLGDLYVQLEDWGRAQGVIDALARSDVEGAAAMADDLSVRVLAGRSQRDELQALLERQASSSDGANRAIGATIRLRLADDDLQGALDFLDDRLAEFPNDPDLRLISAGLMALEGNPEKARETLRRLVEERPEIERPWIALYNLHRSLGEREQADDTLNEALQALPESPLLNWAKAGDLEQKGEFEAAIAIYEELYAQNSGSAVVANNLASLISSFREDRDSLERAYAIARRLRGTDVPQFQDTYGWIAARLGNHQEALNYLEPAAKALPKDPVVRYHLARAFDLAGRQGSALETYRATRELIEAGGRLLPFRDHVDAEIVRLSETVPTEKK